MQHLGFGHVEPENLPDWALQPCQSGLSAELGIGHVSEPDDDDGAPRARPGPARTRPPPHVFLVSVRGPHVVEPGA